MGDPLVGEGVKSLTILKRTAANLGLEGGRNPPQGFYLLPTQRVPLCTIVRYCEVFGFDPKIFLECTIFEGERAPKKRVFLVNIFQNKPKNAFLDCFFKNLLAAQKFWSKKGLIYSDLGELQKINLVDLKKKIIT